MHVHSCNLQAIIVRENSAIGQVAYLMKLLRQAGLPPNTSRANNLDMPPQKRSRHEKSPTPTTTTSERVREHNSSIPESEPGYRRIETSKIAVKSYQSRDDPNKFMTKFETTAVQKREDGGNVSVKDEKLCDQAPTSTLNSFAKGAHHGMRSSGNQMIAHVRNHKSATAAPPNAPHHPAQPAAPARGTPSQRSRTPASHQAQSLGPSQPAMSNEEFQQFLEQMQYTYPQQQPPPRQ